MAGLPSRLWPFHHRLQSVPSLDDAGIMASLVRSADANGRRRRSRHRQHDSQGSPLGGRRKRGAEAKAIGRSRGGRTTKIHAIVDSCGRPIALEVTPGQLGDARVATALISAVPPGRSWLATPPTTATGCVASSGSVERSLSFPTTQRARDIIPSMRSPIASAISSSACSAASRTGDASPPATTSSPQASPQPWQSPPSSSGGPD